MERAAFSFRVITTYLDNKIILLETSIVNITTRYSQSSNFLYHTKGL